MKVLKGACTEGKGVLCIAQPLDREQMLPLRPSKG